jgi:hypothetical protein
LLKIDELTLHDGESFIAGGGDAEDENAADARDEVEPNAGERGRLGLVAIERQRSTARCMATEGGDARGRGSRKEDEVERDRLSRRSAA